MENSPNRYNGSISPLSDTQPTTANHDRPYPSNSSLQNIHSTTVAPEFAVRPETLPTPQLGAHGIPVQNWASTTPQYSVDPKDLSIATIHPVPGYFDGYLPPEDVEKLNESNQLRWFRWFLAGLPMYAFLILGIFAAISHHLFYAHYNGRPSSSNQYRLQQYGGVISVIAKTGFCGAIIFAFKQQIWATVRSKHLQISSIDGMFSAAEDPSVILNLELLTNAKVVLFLAILIW
jgi:hypothetical protein